ncbi:hypothetical protein ED236_03300 [Pseudomethylobacillus aquaticus]|uniref:Uncharacterized protein n=1 Tax=Pseudomethylobacillus aquaticus TaxID=2676064 RepID=A0A3N0V7Z9_9PROT|nr:hypothetical protein ED236_03300 [Pseudomethylobacillus aquaticus]
MVLQKSVLTKFKHFQKFEILFQDWELTPSLLMIHLLIWKSFQTTMLFLLVGQNLIMSVVKYWREYLINTRFFPFHITKQQDVSKP